MPDWPWPAVVLDTAPREIAFTGPMVKGYFISDHHTGPELLVAAQDVVDPALVTVTESGVGMLEVCPVGVTKAAGIQVVLDKFGIDWSDVLVFGDATNDLSMIQAAGHSVAMPNGHPWVQAAASPRSPPPATTTTASPSTSRNSSNSCNPRPPGLTFSVGFLTGLGGAVARQREPT